jgi:ribosome-associated protein
MKRGAPPKKRSPYRKPAPNRKSGPKRQPGSKPTPASNRKPGARRKPISNRNSPSNRKPSPDRKPIPRLKPRPKPPVARPSPVRAPPQNAADDVRPLALEAIAAALEKKAERPTLLDVRELSSYADYVLLLSGDSERQLDAIARTIEGRLRAMGKRPRGIEAAGETSWMLLDYGDLVIHIFFPESRAFYDLEGLWADAPRVPLAEPATTANR